MPFGTPGGDVQPQAMLQVFLNINVFGMVAQAAIEAPRFANYSFPGSFEPHAYFPARLHMENSLVEEFRARSCATRGHKVYEWDGLDVARRRGVHDRRTTTRTACCTAARIRGGRRTCSAGRASRIERLR